MLILHFIHTIDRKYGGVSSYLQLLSRSLGSIVDLHIATSQSDNELNFDNCTVHYLRCGIKDYYAFKKSFCDLLANLQPDIVHVNGCWLPQYSMTINWSKMMGFKVVLSPHGMLEPWNIKKNYWFRKKPALLLYQRSSIKNADALVATSEQERKNLFLLKYNNNIFLVPNGINTQVTTLRENWEESKRIFFLALLRENKGVDLLLKAVSKIRDHLNGWRVVIAGMPSDYSLKDVEQMAKELYVDNITDVIGGVFGNKKWDLYKSSDVFVLPTLNENFGIVIAESLLCGTPVITTKGAPWPDLVTQKCGWWVDRNVDEIAYALLSFLETPIDERKNMGVRGHNFVVSYCSVERIAQMMYNMYIDVKNR